MELEGLLVPFKSARGSVIDLVVERIPIKIINEPVVPENRGWQERPLLGAMEKLSATRGLLVAPVDFVHIPKEGVGIVPWSFWS